MPPPTRCASRASCSIRRCRPSSRATTSSSRPTGGRRAGTPSAERTVTPSVPGANEPVKTEDAAVEPAVEDESEPARLHLHMPVDVRNLALAVIAVILSLYALQWAKAVVVPLLLGVMFS